MTLAPGTKLGPYEIVSPLGAGGMGEVYRAHDSLLGRDVAIKILPREFVVDPDRLARFRREAQLLASLHHRNIATIHGLEDSGGSYHLVMELVPARRWGSGSPPGCSGLRRSTDLRPNR
jgi:serine/threonine protein kinase